MPTPPLAALILAAGKSTRMNSKTPKALHPLLGKPLLQWAVDAARDAGATRTVLVVGHQAEQVKTRMGDTVEYVLQAEQKGTGHAVLMARELLQNWDGPLLVLPGDAPLLTPSTLTALLQTHAQSGADATLLTATLDNPESYGRILRNPATGNVEAIVEARDATESQRDIHEISTSVYVFQPAKLFSALDKITPANAQGEYYLTDVVALLAAEGALVQAYTSPDPDIVRGVNTRPELVELAQTLQARLHRAHGLAGVTIIDPLSTHIDAAVKIGADTIIHPFTILTGVTDIGEDCTIGPGARIDDSRIGANVSVRDSYVVASEIGDGTRIGPYANIRPQSIVGKNVKVGDFVELKAAILEDNVSAGHFAYLGDAHIGARTNIGAGTITCNYDPFRTPSKNRTTIGTDAFIGTHTTLVAPVTVGNGAYTAAGSVITDPVPDGALALGRAKQITKEGWVARKKQLSSPE